MLVFYNNIYNNNHFNFNKKNKRLTIHNNSNNNNFEYKNDECGGIIFDKSGNYVLLIKQRLSNKWGLPKGHMNTRELLYDNKLACVKREIKSGQLRAVRKKK